jgi:TRAP-type C4-dicarboxylate transport system permease small subunit
MPPGKIIDTLLEAITAFLMAVMVVLTLLQVIGRYGLQSAFDWTEELARLDLIYLTFVGSIVALRRSQLLRLDFAIHAIPPAVRRWLEVVVDTLSVVVLGVVAWQGIPLLWMFWSTRSAALDWPTTFFYLPVVIGCLGLMLFTGLKVVRALRIKSLDLNRKETTR